MNGLTVVSGFEGLIIEFQLAQKCHKFSNYSAPPTYLFKRLGNPTVHVTGDRFFMTLFRLQMFLMFLITPGIRFYLGFSETDTFPKC